MTHKAERESPEQPDSPSHGSEMLGRLLRDRTELVAPSVPALQIQRKPADFHAYTDDNCDSFVSRSDIFRQLLCVISPAHRRVRARLCAIRDLPKPCVHLPVMWAEQPEHPASRFFKPVHAGRNSR